MKRTLKGALSVLLALTLILALALPCFASTTQSAAITLHGKVSYTNDGAAALIGIPSFTFRLTMTDSKGNVMLNGSSKTEYATVTSNTLGNFTLEMPFTTMGTYYCHIVQVPGEDEYTTYDAAEYDIVINVFTALKTGLTAEATVYNDDGEKLAGPDDEVTVSFSNARERYLIPQYVSRTLTDSATGVVVSGTIHSDAKLKVTKDKSGVYEVVLDGKFRNALTVAFPVKDEDGAIYTVLHVMDDGSVEYIYSKVKSNKLTVEVTELSGFYISQGFYVKGWNNPYSDVAMGAWYYSNVAYATEFGLMEGDKGKFSPDANTTRAMFITVLYRMAGNKTSDKANPWYSEARTWAMKNGISDGTNMDGVLTREQMAALLYNYEKLQGGGFTGSWMFQLPFTDLSDISGWAYEGVAWCYMNDIIEGDNGYVHPRQNATRAQVAAVLERYCEG